MPKRDLSEIASNTISLEAFGVSLVLAANSEALIHAISRSLPWAVVAAVDQPAGSDFRLEHQVNADGAVYVGYASEAPLFRVSDALSAVTRFEATIRLTVAEHAKDRVFVHAGVVGWRGKAILIPGRSFAGKSSLVAALLEQGATYYSDEYAVCDADGFIHPFHRALRLRTSMSVKAEQADAKIGERPPLRAGLIVATRFGKRPARMLRTLTVGQGVLELLDNTVSARRDPETAFTFLARAVAGAAMVKGVRGEASNFAATLLSRYVDW